MTTIKSLCALSVALPAMVLLYAYVSGAGPWRTTPGMLLHHTGAPAHDGRPSRGLGGSTGSYWDLPPNTIRDSVQEPGSGGGGGGGGGGARRSGLEGLASTTTAMALGSISTTGAALASINDATVAKRAPRHLGPGPLAVLLPGPGLKLKPGNTLCATLMAKSGQKSHGQIGNAAAEAPRGPVTLMQCGEYGEDRSSKPLPAALAFEWLPESGRLLLRNIRPDSSMARGPSSCLGVSLAAGESPIAIAVECSSPSLGRGTDPVGGGVPTDSDQLRWSFVHLGGRHKEYGGLRHEQSGMCLTQPGALSGRSSQLLLTNCTGVLAPGGAAGHHPSCTQTWTLAHQFVAVAAEKHDDHRPATAKAAPAPAGSRGHAVGQTRDAPFRVLCWVLTYPKAHEQKATAVNKTWGRYCDTLLFMTTEHYRSLQTVVVNIGGPEDRGRLWNKSRESWMYVYRNHLETHDWFIKVDDDTFIVWPHLIAFLRGRSPEDAAYFGRPYNATRGRYYAGGSGIVLSRAALHRLGSSADRDYYGTWGKMKNGPEDLYTGKAMTTIGIETEPAIDSAGRHLFLPLGPNFEWNAKKQPVTFWFWRIVVNTTAGPSCCSPQWIGVHYVKPAQMFLLDDYESARCTSNTDEWPHLQLGGPTEAIAVRSHWHYTSDARIHARRRGGGQ